MTGSDQAGVHPSHARFTKSRVVISSRLIGSYVTKLADLEPLLERIAAADVLGAIEAVEGLSLTELDRGAILQACAEANAPIIASVALRGGTWKKKKAEEHPLVTATRRGHWAMVNLLARRPDASAALLRRLAKTAKDPAIEEALRGELENRKLWKGHAKRTGRTSD